MTVNVALVGLGYWGPNLARNLAVVKDGRLHTLCDEDRERLDRLRSLYPAARLTRSFEEVLGDPAVDAVVLASPVDTHFSLARAALAAGKHVMVEKPLARTVAECEELIAVAEDRTRVLMVGHVFLYNPAVRRVGQYIDDGEVGEVLYVYSQRLNLGQVRRDVNAMWNFAPHDLSILRYWLKSDPVAVLARGYSYIQPGIEDVAFMTLDYPGGVGANVHISWLDPFKLRRMTVVGSDKMIVYDDVSADARITIYDKGVTRQPRERPGGRVSLGRYETYDEFQLTMRVGDVLIPKVDFSEPLRLECQHFVDCVRDGTVPVTDGLSGLAVVRTLEAAQRSLATASLQPIGDEGASSAGRRSRRGSSGDAPPAP